MVDEYIAKEIDRIRKLESVYGSDYVRSEIKRIEAEGFIGKIPAFSRLAIIYEKDNRIDDAIDICRRAISFGQPREEFDERIRKLQLKRGK